MKLKACATCMDVALKHTGTLQETELRVRTRDTLSQICVMKSRYRVSMDSEQLVCYMYRPATRERLLKPERNKIEEFGFVFF